jgi:broad specificity phosphatase PhoE
MSNNSSNAVSNEIILIRHAEVDSAWKGICYGCLDVPLSQQGMTDSLTLAERISAKLQGADTANSPSAPTVILHSGLSRTAFLAQAIAQKICNEKIYNGEVITDQRLKERNYGLWHGQSWDSAFNSDPEHFHDLIDQPDFYRPPEGETTTEMQQRIVSWYDNLSAQFSGSRIIAVSHSGPIAALAGHLLNLPATQWSPWIIHNLESIVVDHSVVQRLNKNSIVVGHSVIQRT